MSTEKIIEQIKNDSEKEVKKILTEAKNQAKKIIETAKNEAKTEYDKIVAEGKSQSENIKKIQISKANQEIKRQIMNAKEEIIEKCFFKAHHELTILKGDRYEKIVKKLIEDGKKKLGINCTVTISRDADEKISEKLGLSVSGRVESSGGIKLVSLDGKIILDQTFESILRRNKHKIRIKVGKLLFS